jgi:dihydroorotate dehydrogenase electron transfer subunit
MAVATAPDHAAQRLVEVVENVPIARDTYRLRLADPEMARDILPGQFLMVRPGPAVSAGVATDPFFGRPFAVYEVVRDGGGEAVALDVVYLILGRGTAALSTCRPGDRLSIWGPLGHGFGSPPAEGEVVFVAGGIGQTPFLSLGKSWLGRAGYGPDSPTGTPGPGPFAREATLLYGARDASLLAGLDDFRTAGIDVQVATDNGSAGHQGYVTDLLRARLERGERPAKVVGCGPVPMLAVLARIAEEFDLDCDVSLESPMACGFGACFSCVVPIVQDDGSTDLRRICVEGPIFPARAVGWSAL